MSSTELAAAIQALNAVVNQDKKILGKADAEQLQLASKSINSLAETLTEHLIAADDGDDLDLYIECFLFKRAAQQQPRDTATERGAARRARFVNTATARPPSARRRRQRFTVAAASDLASERAPAARFERYRYRGRATGVFSVMSKFQS